jgi:hypothetical protein
MPYKLVCCSISALEPSGSASQKALLELLRLFNHRLRSSAPLGAPFACFTGTKAQQLTHKKPTFRALVASVGAGRGSTPAGSSGRSTCGSSKCGTTHELGESSAKAASAASEGCAGAARRWAGGGAGGAGRGRGRGGVLRKWLLDIGVDLSDLCFSQACGLTLLVYEASSY